MKVKPDHRQNMEYPFVSFCMTSYNQKEYALRALEAAIKQDYPNMEIVCADDGSSDGSAEALKELALKYKRNIRILTSSVNMGLIKNFEKLFRNATGELIISADGDDISLPNRVSRIVEEWVKQKKRATVIIHDGIKIDPHGRKLGFIGVRSIECPLGAVMAYSPRVVQEFPCIEMIGASQDHVLGRRGILLGSEVLVLPDKLVEYRIGTGASTIYHTRRTPELRSVQFRIESFRQLLLDVEYLMTANKLTKDKYYLFKRQYESNIERLIAYYNLISSSAIRIRLNAYKKLYRHKFFTKEAFLRLPYLLPTRICDGIFYLHCQLKVAKKLLLKG